MARPASRQEKGRPIMAFIPLATDGINRPRNKAFIKFMYVVGQFFIDIDTIERLTMASTKVAINRRQSPRRIYQRRQEDI